MKANRALFYTAGLLVIVLVGRFIRSYPLPEAQVITPPEIVVYSREDSGSYIDILMTNNLWDRNRGSLDASSETGGGRETDSAEINSGIENGGSWQLVGVSLSDNLQIAVIKNGNIVKSVKPGDQLPDGAEVIKILPFGIQTTKLGKNDNIYLFGKK